MGDDFLDIVEHCHDHCVFGGRQVGHMERVTLFVDAEAAESFAEVKTSELVTSDAELV